MKMFSSEIVTLAETKTGPSSLDYDLARRGAEALMRHYPQYLWATHCDNRTGMYDIKCLSLSGNWGYRLKIADVQHESSMRCVIMAGGEILERYRMRRGVADEADVAEARQIFSGVLVFDR